MGSLIRSGKLTDSFAVYTLDKPSFMIRIKDQSMMMMTRKSGVKGDISRRSRFVVHSQVSVMLHQDFNLVSWKRSSLVKRDDEDFHRLLANNNTIAWGLGLNKQRERLFCPVIIIIQLSYSFHALETLVTKLFVFFYCRFASIVLFEDSFWSRELKIRKREIR